MTAESTAAVERRAPLAVALTGGVASGKSAVCRSFAQRAVPILDADIATRELVRPGEPALAEIAGQFGAAVIAADGTLDRAAMRRLVFEDAEKRRALEAILHPRAERRLATQLAQLGAPYCIVAIPLLAEVGRYPWLDAVIVVDVPTQLQRERLMRRDDIGAELADAMIAAQATREARLALADYVIDNSGSEAELDRQVGLIDRLLRERANRA